MESTVHRLIHLIGDYDRWVTTILARPTVAVLAIVSTVIALILLPSIRHWTYSTTAFFWWKVANALCWNYFLWAVYLTPASWAVHFTSVFLHLFIITGVFLITTVIGKYLFGWEDQS